ncbi:MAG: HDIG domain-containing protein [Tannerellaceae bacterium]|jgi:putative nucleotidyltransferase with HDIG domain|nr:HDIG domain-containing protein [Tannerellaceae bacterium]
MKVKTRENAVIIYFIVAILAVAYFFPKEGKFKYQYYEGKPWRYGLLTAPFDFPVYKTQAEVKREQDSIMQYYQPYFQIKNEVEQEQLKKLNTAFLHKKDEQAYLQYLRKILQEIYDTGIIGRENQQFLQKGNYKSLWKVKNTEAVIADMDDIYTVQTAYSKVIELCPEPLSRDTLASLNINHYIVENLIYDESMSNKVKTEFLQKISLSKGMVQAGERIVDQGVIIDREMFNTLNSLKTVSQSRLGTIQRQNWIWLGIFVLIMGTYACFYMYLYFFRQQFYAQRKDAGFLLSMITLFVLLTEIAVSYNLFNVYIIPYVIVPIVVCTFFDTRTALFTHITMILLCAMMAPFPSEFMTLQIIAGMTAIFSLKDLTERYQLIRCSFFVLLSYVILYTGLTLFQEGSIAKIRWPMFVFFGINFFFLMFTYTFVYFIEKMFSYISNISLVELSNINRPILRKLSETAPGTFQHSLQVSILATEAAARINANIQLTRTGALYHDIGKMSNPAYFTENQTGGFNPHANLSLEESAGIIIGHVTEGERIARKYKLPEQLIHFIQTHHGCGKAKYFYNSFKNEFPDKPIDEAIFTYPGPNPFSKETAILMMADSVEAASRSLKEYTDETISELINRIIDEQFKDGLLKNTPLTFKELEEIKVVFNEKLRTFYHTRISYPELKK